MSRTNPSGSQAAQLMLACPNCRAAPDRWCTTKLGHFASDLHGARWNEVRTLVRLSGYQEWLDDLERRRIAVRKQLHVLRSDCAGLEVLSGPNVFARLTGIIGVS